MIVHPQTSRNLIDASSMAMVRADAMTRIPTIHFYGPAWAKDSIATCSALLAQAARGDRAGMCRWVIDAGRDDDAQARYAVLRALSDALIANAFAEHGEIRDVAEVLTLVESDVLEQLERSLAEETGERMNDPQLADIAAALVRLVALRDPQSAAHLDAVAALARRIAVAMGFGTHAVHTIGLAANLHDIGTAGVDSGVLAQPGPLDPAQRHDVESHAELGAQALEEVPGLAFLAPIVRAHHERVDGTGYPDGLSGEQIPLAARVIAVADAYIAMTSSRSFRPPLAQVEALTRLSESAGTQFDADVVEAALELFKFARRPRRAIA